MIISYECNFFMSTKVYELNYYFSNGRDAKCCDHRVCVSVCLFVCPFTLSQTTRVQISRTFCVLTDWLWPGPHLTTVTMYTVRYVLGPTQPFILSGSINQMSSELQLDVRCLSCCGGDIWWTLTKERPAWCYLQVKLCDHAWALWVYHLGQKSAI